MQPRRTGIFKPRAAWRSRAPMKPSASTRTPAPAPAPAPAPVPVIHRVNLTTLVNKYGLEALAGTSTNVLFHRPKSQVQLARRIKEGLTLFLGEGYCFKTPADVGEFVVLLEHIGWPDRTWTTEHYQFLLCAVSSPNGLQRLSDVIIWQPVCAGHSTETNALSFQRVYVPLLMFLASDCVAKSLLHHLTNSLYQVLIDSLDVFWVNLQSSVKLLMKRGSFKDDLAPTERDSLLAMQIFVSLTVILHECQSRFNDFQEKKPIAIAIAHTLQAWVQTFATQIRQSPKAFDGAFDGMNTTQRDHILEHIETKSSLLVRVFERKCQVNSVLPSPVTPTFIAQDDTEGGILAQYLSFSTGPGNFNQLGPRHDNDHEDIDRISIPPTEDELTCELAPYLPPNFLGAPHHLPQHSMERHLDIQFRLLREEFVAPLREAIHLVDSDLSRSSSIKGGRYMQGTSYDWNRSRAFSVYTGVTLPSNLSDKRGIALKVEFDSPPGLARSSDPQIRVEYWSRGGERRLAMGGLIALVWKSSLSISIELGTIASSHKDLKESARERADRMTIWVKFFNPDFELRLLDGLRSSSTSSQQDFGCDFGSQTCVLIDPSILYDAFYPLLSALQVEPKLIPLARHIVQPFDPQMGPIPPPRYAQFHGFSYQLESLFPPEAGVKDLKLNVLDPESAKVARQELKQSRLDESQANALVDALSSEVALIQGPPGTGKSYTAVELLRVILPKVKPILVVALTNHALDHLLSSILSSKMTSEGKVIRLGGGTANGKISQLSGGRLQDIVPFQTPLLLRYRKMLKDIQSEIKELKERMDCGNWDIESHIRESYPGHMEQFLSPPSWIEALGRIHILDGTFGSLYELWIKGKDLKRPRREMSQVSSSQSLEEKISRDSAFHSFTSPFVTLSYDDGSADWEPLSTDGRISSSEQPVTATDFHKQTLLEKLPPTRSPQDLLLDKLVWEMSLQEREKLHAKWTIEVKEEMLQEYFDLREQYNEVSIFHEEVQDDMRRQLFHNVDVIAATTTGAAKHTALIRALEPRVLLVEEAGQVLEAHIFASLVPSIEHLILVGDPLQLRPTIGNYSLSIESKIGKRLFKFDVSLMERLSSSGFPMSRIDVQRRMRPGISRLIRTTLYDTLIDHEDVKKYPHVRGMARDIYFLNHRHLDSGDNEDSTSRFNMYEVHMIRDLVLYLLKQGYSKKDDIVVLCTYWKQLDLVRRALVQESVLVDETKPGEPGAEEDNEQLKHQNKTVKHSRTSKMVRIRTVDNFQGEEARIVILSLVRNAGSRGENKPNIGFLKSPNRTNVALSRAKEGLYILGNAEELRSSDSKMWHGVVSDLVNRKFIGDELPIACARHRDTVSNIKDPGQIAQVAPNGGCLLPCATKLRCGHICPYKCHPDDPNHFQVCCSQSCTKSCVRGHLCMNLCSNPCQKCIVGVVNPEYPDSQQLIPCHMLDELGRKNPGPVTMGGPGVCKKDSFQKKGPEQANWRASMPTRNDNK